MKANKRDAKSCPECEGGRLRYAVRDVPIARRSLKAVVPQVAGWFCDTCRVIEFDEGTDSGDRFAALGDQLVLKARDLAQQQGRRLREARTKRNITQAEAAELAGGGHNAFSRYETGAAQPVAAVVHLFALLERHPELLKEARELAKATQSGATAY